MKIESKMGPGKQQLDRLLKNMENKVAKVGWFESARYESGTPVAYVATIQEYGCPEKNIPPRSFMRSTVAKKQNDWKELTQKVAESIIHGGDTPDTGLEKIGSKAAGDIRKTITEITHPPLKQATIDARLRNRSDKKTMGFLNKPLVDTGTMLNSLTHVVEDEKK